MRKVWAVTSGEYSDYGIDCICPTEADADDIAERWNTYTAGEYGQTRQAEEFVMVSAAEAHRVEVLNLTWSPGRGDEEHIRVAWNFATEPVEAYGNGGYITVRGSDHERVRKVYSERRAQLIAHLEGLT